MLQQRYGATVKGGNSLEQDISVRYRLNGGEIHFAINL
jgi:hypothetical protein